MKPTDTEFLSIEADEVHRVVLSLSLAVKQLVSERDTGSKAFPLSSTEWISPVTLKCYVLSRGTILLTITHSSRMDEGVLYKGEAGSVEGIDPEHLPSPGRSLLNEPVWVYVPYVDDLILGVSGIAEFENARTRVSSRQVELPLIFKSELR